MKTILLLLILSITLSMQLFAQEETLIGSGEITHGGFGGPVVKFTQINDEFGLLVGGRGGWIINNTFVLGLGGYGLVNNIEADDVLNSIFGDKPFLNFGYGGFEMEYIIHSDRLLHFTVYTLVGGGAVTYRDELWDNWDDWDFGQDAFFVFEPAVNVELNVYSFFRLNAGVSYRMVSGVDFDTLENSKLSGPSAVLTLKFGSF